MKERDPTSLTEAGRVRARGTGLKGDGSGSRQALSPVLDAVAAPVLLASGDRILYANPACSSLLGQADCERLIGRSLSGTLEARVVGQKAKKDLLLWLLSAKTVSGVVSEPMDFLCQEREIAMVRMTRRAFTFEQEGLALVTIDRASVESTGPADAIDGPVVTEAERLASVAQLASTAAQAVNNPLAYIASNVTYSSERLRYISALLDESSAMQVSDPRMLRGLLLPVQEALGEAHVGAGRASQLIKDLRSLVEQDAAFSPIDVNAALEAALNMADAEVSLRARLRANLEATGFVLGSMACLTQLFLSLIYSRAHTLGGDSPQRYRIDVRSRTESGCILVSVSDNGAAVRNLGDDGGGEPILGSSTEGAPPSLALCRQLAASLNGSLFIEESADWGTVTTVELPLKDSSRRPQLSSLSPIEPGRRTRVLIVDNEPLIVRALSRLLKGDYDVETAGGGHEALDLIEHAGPFDLVLCDLAMPEMNGLELFQQTVIVAPDMGPRFVFVTGGAVADGLHPLLESLPNRILEKPIQPERLREVVGQLLGTRQNQRP